MKISYNVHQYRYMLSVKISFTTMSSNSINLKTKGVKSNIVWFCKIVNWTGKCQQCINWIELKRETYSNTLLRVSNYNHKIYQISLFSCRWLFYRSNNGHREQLCELLHSHKAQYAIIALVVVDMIIVIAELLLDLKAIKGGRPSSFQDIFIL